MSAALPSSSSDAALQELLGNIKQGTNIWMVTMLLESPSFAMHPEKLLAAREAARLARTQVQAGANAKAMFEAVMRCTQTSELAGATTTETDGSVSDDATIPVKRKRGRDKGASASASAAAAAISSCNSSSDDSDSDSDDSVVRRSSMKRNHRRRMQKKARTAAAAEVVLEYIQLFPFQVDHYARVQQIVAATGRLFDPTVMGGGKTYILLKYCRDHRMPLVYTGPAAMRSKMHKLCQRFGVELIDFLSYAKIRGQMGRVKHRWLERTDTKHTYTDRMGDTCEYTSTAYKPTDALRELVARGAVFAFDEAQSGKNVGNQNEAMAQVVRLVYGDHVGDGQVARFSPSCVFLMSATPIDKAEQAYTFGRLAGLVPDRNVRRLYHSERGSDEVQIENEGIWPFVQWCMGVDAVTTARLIANLNNKDAPLDDSGENEDGDLGDDEDESDEDGANALARLRMREFMSDDKQHTARKRFNRFLLGLVSKVALTRISSAMSCDFGVEKDLASAYYLLANEAELAMYTKGVNLLKDALEYREEEGDGGAGGAVGQISSQPNWKEVTEAMQMIEASKVSILVRLAKNYLERNPNNKVALFVNYHASLDRLERELAEFHPLRLDGKVSESLRSMRIDMFQEHNADHRLLITTTRVGGVGVDMHDTHGAFPRFAFVLPDYSVQNSHQAPGRFVRAGAKSRAFIRFVFGMSWIEDDANPARHMERLEYRIFRSLCIKSDVLKKMAPQQIKDGVKFLIDLGEEREATRANNTMLPVVLSCMNPATPVVSSAAAAAASAPTRARPVVPRAQPAAAAAAAAPRMAPASFGRGFSLVAAPAPATFAQPTGFVPFAGRGYSLTPAALAAASPSLQQRRVVHQTHAIPGRPTASFRQRFLNQYNKRK